MTVLPLAGPVLALDIGGTQLRGGVVEPDGRVVASQRIRTPVEDGGPGIVDAAIALLRRVAQADGSAAVGIGISSAGPVDPFRGWILAR